MGGLMDQADDAWGVCKAHIQQACRPYIIAAIQDCMVEVPLAMSLGGRSAPSAP